MGSFNRSFSALMRRNLIYRKRRWLSSIFEFILPIVFIAILVAIKASLENSDSFKPETIEADFPENQDALTTFSFSDFVTALQAKRECIQGDDGNWDITGIRDQGYNWPVPFVKCDSRQCDDGDEGKSAENYCSFPILAVAPEEAGNSKVNELVGNFTAYVDETYQLSSDEVKDNFLFKYDFVQTFGSNDALEDYVKSKDYGKSGFPKVGVAVVFKSSSSDKAYEYTIRVNSTNFNAPEEEARPVARTTPDTARLFDSFAKENDNCAGEGGTPALGFMEKSCTGQYMYNGALAIQRLVDDWILWHSGAAAEGSFVAENGVQYVSFPTREYVKNGFYADIAPFAPLLVVLGLLYPVSAMIRGIVQEKELRQKELMKMMSVPESAIGWSWFMSLFLFYFVSAIATAATTKGLYSNSAFAALFFFWLFAFIAVITFAFAISSLFSRATRATLVGLLLFFIGYFLTLVVDYETANTGLIGLVSLHPVAAFSYGLQVIGQLEDAGVGLTGDTWDQSDNPSGYAFSNSFAALITCSILWGVVSWYLNRVIRGDFGQPLPWYFPFTQAYWCPGRAAAPVEAEDPDGDANKQGDDLIPIEQVSDALKEQEREGRSVEIRNLRKDYGAKTAVDGLSLSMYSGQVTALLGHNGAGKTTTINMLTGMVAPTSGYAVVAGKDIRTQMTTLREEVGICLQHDCLFPLLTVKEHVQFYARIKGMYANKTRDEMKASVKSSIEDVALLEKRNTLSKDLSGGMKRKLSVAIAFCGDSKVVFLDEPTSGMDPFSRRFTWNVIRQYRQDRCIILTTHFMDEADLLGDRIAIMAEGQLRCAGSSLFLKKSFGVGYQLTIEKKTASKAVPDTIDEEPNGNANGDAFDDEPAQVHVSSSGPDFEASFEAESLTKSMGGGGGAVDVAVPVAVEDRLKYIVTSAVREATLLSNVGTEMSFQLPLGASEHFIGMFENLDKEVESGNIVTYGVSITTLDEVFLMVARGEYGAKSRREYGSVRLSQTDIPVMEMERSHHSKMDLEKEGLFFRHVRALFAKRAMNFKRDKKAWCCSTFLPSIFAFAGFLIVVYASPSRNLKSLTLTLADNNPNENPQNPIPYNNITDDYTCQPGVCLYPAPFFDLNETDERYTYCGGEAELERLSDCNSTEDASCLPPCSIWASDDIMAQVTENGAKPVGDAVSTIGESSRSVFDSSSKFAASQYGAVYFSHDRNSSIPADGNENSTLYGDAAYEACVNRLEEFEASYQNSSQCDRFRGIGYVVSYNFTSLHSALLYQAVADEAIMKEALDDSYSISSSIHPLPITDVEQGFAAGEDSFSAWFLLVLSFPFITGAFATFVVAERMSKAKHLQTVAGVKPSAYWISSFLWDILNYQFPLWIVIIFMFALGVDAFTTTERNVAGGVIVTLILFGPAAAGFTYCTSFGFKSPSMCNLFVIVFNFLIGMAGPLVCFILRIIGEDTANPNQTLISISTAVEWILRPIPSFCFGRALFYTINIETMEYFAQERITVWDNSVILYDVVFLAIESVGYVLLAIQMDILSTNPGKLKCFVDFVTCKWCCCRDPATITEAAGAGLSVDEDVAEETQRVLSGGANEDLIVMNQLTKRYPNGKLAVNHMSLGIPAGECFGLLGINGAGKTSTMGMLTAEFPPTEGDATLAGYSVTHEPEQTRRRIGYCPQFDAHFMNMTGREHVELYASIKGVPKGAVKEAAAFKLREVGLSEFDSERLSAGYSGGMKRKLSVACATIGQPQIVFLDEPSTGMDPVARRDMWQVISDMVTGDGTEEPQDKTSVILTTHSMEECEALCPRLGIMAAGRLTCLGSAQHLKTRFGKGYQVELKIKDVSDDDDDYKATLSSLLSAHTGVAVDPEAQISTVGMFLKLDQAQRVASSLTDDDSLSGMINPNNPTGYVVYKNATSDVGVSLDELAAFCVNELRMKALLEFFETTYENSILRERQDGKARFEVGSEGLKVSSLFNSIEENKEKLKLADYGVSQTSLEQVFNTFAAEAEKLKHNTDDG